MINKGNMLKFVRFYFENKYDFNYFNFLKIIINAKMPINLVLSFFMTSHSFLVKKINFILKIWRYFSLLLYVQAFWTIIYKISYCFSKILIFEVGFYNQIV